MKVSLIQSFIEWLNPINNRAALEEMMSGCDGANLIILAEMFSTGFCMEPEQSAASGGETLEWMKRMAVRHNATIAGSVAVEEAGCYYNRLYVVAPSGHYTKYDKRHLFTFAGEDERYTAGDSRVVVEIEGVKVLLLVCYDLRFPVWIRNRGDYDMILCVANWPSSRRKVWDTLLRARAIENVAYACGVNVVGEDPTSSYSGGSAVIDFRGDEVASVADGEYGVVTTEIDMEALRRFRERFPVLGDSDDFEMIN